MTTRAALYTRISQTSDDVDKVEIQERRLREAAAREGYDVVEVFTDDGISAFSGKLRPSFVSLVEGIRAGRFDIIMAVAPDRFARTIGETDALHIECATHGVKLHTLTAGITDPTSAMSKAMASIAGVLAELESAVKSERIKVRFEDKARQGLPKGGKRPFGWEPGGVVVRESEAALIRAAYDSILNGGGSQHSVAKAWNEAGVLTTAGGKWTSGSVRDLLLRPSNAGVLMVNGVRQATSLIEPIVSEATVEQYTALVGSRVNKSGPKVKALLSGIMTCPCGAPMVKSSKDRGRDIYRCKARLTPGDGVAHSEIRTASADEQALSGLVGVIREGGLGDVENDQAVAEAQMKLVALRDERKRLSELLVVGGIDPTVVQGRLLQIVGEMEAADADLDRALAGKVNMPPVLKSGLALMHSIREFTGLMGAKVPGAEGVADKAIGDWLAPLSVDDKRALLRATVDIRLTAGAGANRVQVQQKGLA